MARKPPVPVITIGGARISFSTRIGPHLTRSASTGVRDFLRKVGTLDPHEALGLLDDLADATKDAQEAARESKRVAREIRAAAAALAGEAYSETSPLIEVAALVREQAATARAFDETLELAEVQEVAERLEKLADHLDDQHESQRRKLADLESYLAKATDAVLALPDSPFELVLSRHTPSDDLARQIDHDGDGPPDPVRVRAHAAAVVGKIKTAIARKKAANAHAETAEIVLEAREIWSEVRA